MITGPVSQFEARLTERGYTWDEVEMCIVSRDGDMITVDETHYAYPRKREEAPKPSGPGTELKKMFAWLRIVPRGDCECNSHAAKMDQLGEQWVRDNIETVINWIEEEARKRGVFANLAFNRTWARTMILIACKNAERQSSVEAT